MLTLPPSTRVFVATQPADIWLFAGSDQGGHTAAVLYTMTQTCKHHRIDPFVYLQDVLSRLPELPPERLAELVPHAWAQSQRSRAETPG